MVAGKTLQANILKAAGLDQPCSAGSECVGYDEATGKANQMAPRDDALGLCAHCIRTGVTSRKLLVVPSKNGISRR